MNNKEQLKLYSICVSSGENHTITKMWYLMKDKDSGFYKWMDLTENLIFPDKYSNIESAEEYLDYLIDKKEIIKWNRV